MNDNDVFNEWGGGKRQQVVRRFCPCRKRTQHTKTHPCYITVTQPQRQPCTCKVQCIVCSYFFFSGYYLTSLQQIKHILLSLPLRPSLLCLPRPCYVTLIILSGSLLTSPLNLKHTAASPCVFSMKVSD